MWIGGYHEKNFIKNLIALISFVISMTYDFYQFDRVAHLWLIVEGELQNTYHKLIILFAVIAVN